MNKILTDVGSWINIFLTAGLIKVYFAQAYSHISKTYGVYEASTWFKFKTIVKHRIYCCRYDDKFEEETDHVGKILDELSTQISINNLQKLIREKSANDNGEAQQVLAKV